MQSCLYGGTLLPIVEEKNNEIKILWLKYIFFILWPTSFPIISLLHWPCSNQIGCKAPVPLCRSLHRLWALKPNTEEIKQAGSESSATRARTSIPEAAYSQHRYQTNRSLQDGRPASTNRQLFSWWLVENSHRVCDYLNKKNNNAPVNDIKYLWQHFKPPLSKFEQEA